MTQIIYRNILLSLKIILSIFIFSVFQLYGDYDFGPYDINLIHLSRRYSTGHDGYYGCEMKLDL